MSVKTQYKNLSSALLGVVSASLVLFPSILGIVARPLVGEWLIWAFLVSSVLALVLEAFVFYICSFTPDSVPAPVRISGFGTFASLIGLGSFITFLFANIRDDQLSIPQVISLTPSSLSVAPGDLVGFSAETLNENGERLTWCWQVRPKPPGNPGSPVMLPGTTRTTQWLVPADAKPGIFEVGVSAACATHPAMQTWTMVKVEKKEKPK
jgi:hypothetical protein